MFIDGNHFYQGVSEDFIALESQGDLFMFHDIASEQFVEHTKKLFDEVAAKPAFECRKFIDNYPTGRVGFGIGVCVRRVFLSGPGSVLAAGTGVAGGNSVSAPSTSGSLCAAQWCSDTCMVLRGVMWLCEPCVCMCVRLVVGVVEVGRGRGRRRRSGARMGRAVYWYMYVDVHSVCVCDGWCDVVWCGTRRCAIDASSCGRRGQHDGGSGGHSHPHGADDPGGGDGRGGGQGEARLADQLGSARPCEAGGTVPIHPLAGEEARV